MRRRSCACQAAPGEQPTPSGQGGRGNGIEQVVPDRQLEKVPISELPAKPNPKAMQALNRSEQKVGLNKRIVDNLAGTSFTIVGDDTELNEATARVLAARLGWFPSFTRKVVSGLLGTTPERLAEKDAEQIVKAELSMLTGMRTQRRVCVATMGGGAAAAREAYQQLWGSVIVRVDDADGPKGAKPDTPERQLHAELAEVSLKLTASKGFAKTGDSADEKLKRHETQLIDSIVAYLNANIGDKGKGIMDVIQKKAHYINGGCKGDWPDVQVPEGWQFDEPTDKASTA